MNKQGKPGRRDLHTSQERIDAIKRLAAAVIDLRRSQREAYAALCQAHHAGVRWRTLERVTGVSEDTLYKRVRQLQHGIPDGFMWRL